MISYGQALAILTILLFVAWLTVAWLDMELTNRKEHHLWPYD